MTELSLQQAVEFIGLECDLLDHGEYGAWLDLWGERSFYVIPIDDGDDFANQLNYAYDDGAMRRMRVARLTSGQSVSANDAAHTVRSVSRFRLIATNDHLITVRCAQQLVEYRREKSRVYASNTTYLLQRHGEGFLIEQKIVRLINAKGALGGLTYLL